MKERKKLKNFKDSKELKEKLKNRQKITVKKGV